MDTQVQLVALTLADGSLSITSFATLARGSILPSGATWFNEQEGWWARPATDILIEQEILKICATGPACASWRRISITELPQQGRTYRNAWTDIGTRIDHDMPKARLLHLEMVRKARRAALEVLDQEWMRATGQAKKSEADAIEVQRQALRDAPATLPIDTAQTIEELTALWPVGLPRL